MNQVAWFIVTTGEFWYLLACLAVALGFVIAGVLIGRYA